MDNIKKTVRDFIYASDGLLKLRPAWVAHDFLTPGRRLGLREADYDAGERGFYMERWFCSETHAVNQIDIPDEGMSYLEIPDERILVRDAVALCGEEIMGAAYARSHQSLGRLIKIYDFGTRLFMHFHQRAADLAGTGKSPKDEAYHFLDAPLGNHPETFFGVRRSLVERNKQYDYFLPFLQRWEGDETDILKYSTAFQNVPGEGFFLDSGILHAPGTALTLEIQEPSDVGAILQPMVNGHKIPKSMLLKDVRQADIDAHGEMAALMQVDWDASSDPDFFEKRHLYPKQVEETRQGEMFEEWIYYGTTKFSGKRLILPPGKSFRSVEPGVHNIFVWKGEADVDGVSLRAGAFGLTFCEDELLVICDRAQKGYTVKNTGHNDLVLYKIFGPDIQNGRTPDIG